MTSISELYNIYGNLIVVSRVLSRRRGAYWLCQCMCGKQCIVRGYSLRSGHTKSCGCLGRKNLEIGRLPVHGMFGTRFYRVWGDMKSRCSDPNNRGYKNYGGRGIYVCERWNDFAVFKKDMYESYLKHFSDHRGNTFIERVDNEKGYSPENCTWATRSEQNKNKRPRSVRRIAR